MDGSDLEAIKAQLGGVGGGSGANDKGKNDNGEMSKQEEQRQTMLTQILTPDAMLRLRQMSIVKQDKVRGVEDMLIRMARMNQIRERVTEERLKEMLMQINAEHDKETQIVYSRKGYDDSDDDVEYDFE
ncbi:hypothetical protein GGH94_002089 [Coemansia aciculifera]|uniref:Programmed cell death protein 5 n=2 Tax=Coemansia TaxID=4863 RepID=A0A9W8LC45_9FUNG|nr:hypothetical protein GGI19_002540 [Coemansia pectinata]KAJ2865645.1 hypothetical protein GGH94_002089 [Coemansia aciculifera]KAJ2874529.1 hypothetical protein GGH93_002334 [Coemansia aciculifera]KAJ2880567.1 hypothetical protein H4R27_004644 [Coemansia aciculifera]